MIGFTKSISPLQYWKTDTVTRLLYEFYSKNFDFAGIPGDLAKELILDSFYSKESLGISGSKNMHESVELEEFEVALASKLVEVQKRARDLATNPPTEVFPMDLIDLSEVEYFLDYGANKLTTINRMAKNFPNTKSLVAVDVVPQQQSFVRPEISSYFQVGYDLQNFELGESKFDFINLQYVLHHMQEEDLIKKLLKKFQSLLKPNGRLLLWEESFSSYFDLNDFSSNRSLGVQTDIELTRKFYELTEDERWEFVVVNDWVLNVNNSHMQWSYEYRKIGEWLDLFESLGFVLKRKFELGLRVNGHVKQGVNVLMEFELGGDE